VDRRERISDLTLMFRAALQGWQSDIWTALPGTYQGAGSKKGTANVQPTVQVQLQSTGNVWGSYNNADPVNGKFTPGGWQNLPLCPDCPILLPGGGGFHATFPLKTGDEGLLVFSSRCIDNWWLAGGPQSQAELRMHDLSDGFFIPGCFSQANVPSADWSTTTARLTSDDGTLYYELDPITHRANVVAAAGLWVNGVMVTVP
jgi:hypothetical protein